MDKELKIAFLITAYNKPDQLVKLINLLGVKNGYENIFVHLDKKCEIDPATIKSMTNANIQVLKKHKVYWGGFNQLKSILSLVKIASDKKKYDFMVLLSGQDLPITSYENVKEFLSNNIGSSFITSEKMPLEYWNYKQGLGRTQWFWFMDHMFIRGIHKLHIISHYIYNKFNLIRPSSRGIEFYGGSDWWMLPGEIAEYCLNEFETNKKIRKCFKYSFIPSEMYFQTVINNSLYSDTITNDSKRYTHWESNSGHPELLTTKYKDTLIESKCLFARKFDLDKSPELVHFFVNNF